jgi:hypothetical protein
LVVCGDRGVPSFTTVEPGIPHPGSRTRDPIQSLTVLDAAHTHPPHPRMFLLESIPRTSYAVAQAGAEVPALVATRIISG